MVARAYNKTMTFLLEEEALLPEIMPREQALEAFKPVLAQRHDVTVPYSVEGLADPLGLDFQNEADLLQAYHIQLAWELLGLLQKAPWPVFVPTPRALQELRVPPTGEQEQKFAEC